MTHLFYYAVWLSFMAFGFLAWFFSHKGRHEERKMLIEKGLNTDDLVKAESGFKKGQTLVRSRNGKQTLVTF